ncbi:MAG: hypothetical protein NDI62_01540 [Burkholderiales bacterium]|nr:hypothetical protein [Burkholderiales bacterium]
MNMEKLQTNNEVIKSIEISKEEIEAINSINKFLDELSQEEIKYFNGPIGYEESTAEKIQEIFEKKKNKLEEKTFSSAEERHAFIFKAKREAEYESCSDVVEYKNNQLSRLIEFIEKQKIWKTKISTASNINYSVYIHKNFENFIQDLKKSEEYHKINSFAGQNRNSLYYISNSGVSLRIKMARLHPNGNIREALQHANELFLCVDEITDPDQKEKSVNGSSEFPSQIVSFEPRLGHRVEEFFTQNFINHQEGNFKSGIKILKEKDKIIIKNSDGYHSGHYINNIYNLER